VVQLGKEWGQQEAAKEGKSSRYDLSTLQATKNQSNGKHSTINGPSNLQAHKNQATL
jgi:hypothetical protein